MQWQHGSFQQLINNTLLLNPIAVDGRQLLSAPCEFNTQSLYTRYNQSETFIVGVSITHIMRESEMNRVNTVLSQTYDVVPIDPYHGIPRLNLFEFDGTPMNPMYLAYAGTPNMLPTSTLNPTSTSTGAPATATSSSTSSKRKRSEPVLAALPIKTRALLNTKTALLNPDTWWWFGISATALGGVAYYFF